MKPLIKRATPFPKVSPMYPLTNLETRSNKQTIDMIGNTFY